MYERTGTVLKTDLKQSYYGDIHMFTHMSKLGVGIIVIEVGVEKM